jgi:predicted secreted Zn-dependent protease
MNTGINQLQISGKILEIGTETANEIGNNVWKKQDFVIQTDEKYPKTISINVWGDNILYLQRCKVGDIVNAMINVNSKKAGERWFTEVTAWKIEVDIQRMKTLKDLQEL